MTTPPFPPAYTAFAVTPVGLENIVAKELESLAPVVTQLTPGGVLFETSLPTLLHLNRTSRLATRFLVRVGTFRVRALGELKRKVSSLNWGLFLSPDRAVSVTATCHKSRIYHSGAAEQRVSEALQEVFGVGLGSDDSEEVQKVYVRIVHDECTLSVDSTGDRLHMRGYRRDAGPAPIRETLAAAVLSLSDWNSSQTLVDPMCGSGTFVIEAASVAVVRDAGSMRDYVLTRWPAWAKEPVELSSTLPTVSGVQPPRCFGFDADASMITKAQKNALNALVSDHCRFSVSDIADLQPPDSTGLVVCNPPYGWRLGTAQDAARNYAALGRMLNQRFRGWRYAILAPNSSVIQTARLHRSKLTQLHNGGRRIVLATGQIS